LGVGLTPFLSGAMGRIGRWVEMLLLESGDYLLLEDGSSKLILEDSGGTAQSLAPRSKMRIR
jgi:hypothetical protein